jgi:hypothetical protein
MTNRWCTGDHDGHAQAEREMVALIAGFGREAVHPADREDFLATLARVASGGVTALRAAMVSGEAPGEARIALARLQLAFAAGLDLPSLPYERSPTPSGGRLPAAVEGLIAAMNEPDDRSGRPGVAALGLGLVVARCIAALHEASGEPGSGTLAAAAWGRALETLAAASLDTRQQCQLPDGIRLLLRYALGTAEVDEPPVPETSHGAAADLPLSISRPNALDAQESAHAVLAGGSLLPVDPASAWHLRCAGGALIFLPVRDAPIASAMSRSVLVGVVMRQRTDNGSWTPAYYVVTRPDRSARFGIVVLSTAGNIVLAGQGWAAGEPGDGSLQWSVRSVVAPGWAPFELDGRVDRGVLAFGDGRSGARRQRQLVTQRRHTGPRIEKVTWTQ